MSGNPQDGFGSLAQHYWTAWGDALRAAEAGAVPGFGTQESAPGGGGWQEWMDRWSRLAQGGAADEALGHFSPQARQWYARMQEVAARFAGREASPSEVAQAWKEALGAAGDYPFPHMFRSLGGHDMHGPDQWAQGAATWIEALRGEGLSWLRVPGFGAGREHQERAQELMRHVAEYQQASGAYGALMLKATQDAFPVFEAMLAARGESGAPVESARALFDLWIDAAEEAYGRVALSQEFRSAYGRLANAQMRVRAGVQRLVEDACAQLGMPTRSELDGAHRKLAELEREVRRLRDAAARTVDGRTAPAAKATSAPVRKTASTRSAKASAAQAGPAAKPGGKPATARVSGRSAPRSGAKSPASTRTTAKGSRSTAKRAGAGGVPGAAASAPPPPTAAAKKAAKKATKKAVKKAVKKGAR